MMSEIFKLIECQKPCTLFKMEVINERANSWEDFYDSTEGIYYAKISVAFKELITISKDEYSYTWLNFIAEVGGYVGLFLGYSVFQATDLIDALLKDVCKILWRPHQFSILNVVCLVLYIRLKSNKLKVWKSNNF